MTAGGSELPEGWAWSALERVATWGSGGTPKKSETGHYDGEIPWAVIGDLNDGLVNNCRGSITGAGLAASSCKLIEPGVLLIAMYGSIGKLGIAGVSMATNQAIAFARPHISSRYLFHYLMSQRSAFSEAGKGATQQNISQTILKAWPVPVPPLAEQERIVGAIEERLSRLDAAETLIDQAGEKTAILTAAVWAVALAHGWSERPLGELLLRSGGKVLRQGWSPQCEKFPSPESGTWGVLKTSAVQPGRFLETENKALPASLEAQRGLEVADGDLLMTSGGPRSRVGVACLVARPRPRLMISDKMFRFRPDQTRLDPAFLAGYLTSLDGLRRLDLLKTGSNDSGLRISQGAFERLLVPVPPMSAQVTMVNSLSAIEAQIVRGRSSLEGVESWIIALRRSILAAAFSGRLVAQDSVNEPADVMLARIAEERSSAGSKGRSRAKSSTKVKESSS